MPSKYKVRVRISFTAPFLTLVLLSGSSSKAERRIWDAEAEMAEFSSPTILLSGYGPVVGYRTWNPGREEKENLPTRVFDSHYPDHLFFSVGVG